MSFPRLFNTTNGKACFERPLIKQEPLFPPNQVTLKKTHSCWIKLSFEENLKKNPTLFIDNTPLTLVWCL